MAESVARTEHKVKLTGRVRNGTIAKTHQANDVVGFSDADGKVKVWPIPEDMLTSGDFFLRTKKGKYILKKHDSLNIFQGVANGYKIRFTCKKVVATLSYWA